jgi:hypothetical protein
MSNSIDLDGVLVDVCKDKNYREPAHPGDTRYVYFLFVDTKKMEEVTKEKHFENTAARVLTRCDYTHVEILFWDCNRLFRITRNTNVEELDDKELRPYHMVMRVLFTSEQVEKMIEYCTDRIGAEYDKKGYFCFVCVNWCFCMTCGQSDVFVDRNKYTCTRLIGGALRYAGLWNMSEAQLDKLDCTDILNFLLKKKPVIVRGLQPRSDLGMYGDARFITCL